MRVLTVITSTLILSAVGVAVGLLFAPQKGSRTRRKISELNHDYHDFISDKLDDFADYVSHPVENMERSTRSAVKKATARAKKIASKVN